VANLIAITSIFGNPQNQTTHTVLSRLSQHANLPSVAAPTSAVAPDDPLAVAYGNLPVSLFLTVAAVLIYSLLLWDQFPVALSVAWVVATLAVGVLRMFTWAAFLRATPSVDASDRWRQWYAVGLVLSGLCWGVGMGAMIYYASGELVGLLVTALMTVCAVSVLTMSPQFAAHRYFLLAALLPPAAIAWNNGTEDSRLLGSMLLVALAVMMLVGQRAAQSMRALGDAQLKLTAAQAQAALSESEARYRALVEWSPDAINVHADGIILYVNPAAMRIFGGKSAADLVGRKVTEFVHPDSMAAVEARRQAIADGSPEVPPQELKFLRLDGTTVLCESRGLRITYLGRPATQISMRDVTERRRAENLLAENMRRTNRILAVSSVGLWEWDVVSNEAYFSPEWKRHLGYADHELPNRYEEWKSRTHPEDVVAVECAVQEFLRGERASYEAEFRMRHRDGSWRWFMSQADLLRDDNGKPVRVMGSHIDITRRREAENLVRENELRFELALKGADLGLWDWQPQTDTAYVNSRWRTMLGLPDSHERFTGADWQALLHPDSRKVLERLVKAAFAGENNGEFEMEVRARHADGSWRWIEVRGAVLARDADGRPTRVVGTHMDVTARKDAELARESLEVQLRESQKMEAVGTLAGGVAHDFNNILAAILGNVELLQRMGGDQKVLRSLDEIRRASNRGRDLVQQILSFSRRQPTTKKTLSLKSLVNDSEILLRTALPAGAQLDIKVDDRTPLVNADATQIVQILMNLTNNAWHALPNECGSIEVSLAGAIIDARMLTANPTNAALKRLAAEHPGTVARLAVRDSGTGMSEATRERIFEPFFTTKPVDEGTGLGLSVVLGIVEAHAGAVVVESALGVGSTFSVFLPPAEALGEAADADSATPVANTMPAADDDCSAVAASERKRHVLYLDDDEAMVYLAERLLEGHGYRVSSFTDQRDALAAIRGDPLGVDLVVTDHNMPGMSGLQVAERVFRMRADLPVAITSGFIDDALQAEADRIGVCALIFKANVVEDFCLAIDRVLRASPSTSNRGEKSV
jgi:PAS domain S-box-containing protein